MDALIHNIFTNLEIPRVGDESFKILFEQKNIKIELINSNSVKNGEVYKQNHDEWVILLEGKATLEIEDIKHFLKSGDSLFIEAGISHRVLLTDKKTLWLAIHIF